MRVVGRVDQILQSDFKRVLVWERSIINILLDPLETLKQVYRGLLVARWWILQIGQRALELNAINIVIQKSSGNSWDERYAN